MKTGPSRSRRTLGMRCWADGDSKAITRRWGVQNFPTLFLIDHEGVIRRVFEGIPGNISILDDAIDKLVSDAENKS